MRDAASLTIGAMGLGNAIPPPRELHTSIEQVYRRHAKTVQARARAILRDEDAARDAVHEVFVRALCSGSTFRNRSSFTTWLYRVTTNYCLNWRRNHARRARLLATLGPRSERDTATPVDERLAVCELLGHVPHALGEIAVYYYVDNMHQDEIATLVGVSRRTIGYRLDVFKKAARDLMGVAASA